MAPEWWGSVIATVRGEPMARLERMIDHLAAQRADGPVEVVLAAPGEECERLERLQPRGAIGRIVLIENPGGQRSAGLNRAAHAAASPLLHRVDARSLPGVDHLHRCHARLTADARVGVVGGRQRPVAPEGGLWQRGMARALANPWVVGAPAYRRSGVGGEVDTVYLGAFRRDELLAIGGYDERLDANEDFDLCQRYRRGGAVVWLEHDLVVDYEARSRPDEVWRQYEAFGAAKVRYWRLRGDRPNGRQLVGLVLPGGAAVAALWLGRRPGRLASAVAAGAAGLLLLDHAAAETPAPVSVRLAAALGGVLVPTAWAAGAYRQLLRSDQWPA